MRKLISAMALILCAAAPAAARGGRTQVDTQEFAVEVCTSAAVSISATVAAPTNVSVAGVSLSSATFIEVYNADSTYILNCAYATNVSSDSTVAAYGREVSPKVGLGFKINLDKFPGIYCLTQNSGATTRAVISFCR